VLNVWPLFLALAILMLGNGLQSSLIGLRGTLEGFSTASLGLVTAGYYVGFLAGSTVAPRMVSEVGHVRVYAGLASLASTATLAHLLVVQPAAWFGLRALTGMCLAGLYVVAESWLNGSSSPTTRGRILAAYMVVVTGGMAAGQLLLATADPGGFTLFVVSSLLVSLAVVPIALVRFPAPAIERVGAVPYRRILAAAPIGLVGAVVTGAANGALMGMGAVWGANSGLSVPRIALLLTLAMTGGVIVQFPLGALSDRFSRRRVIFVTTTVASMAALWLTRLEPGSNLLPLAVLVLGGFTFPMYSLSGSHVNDLVEPELAVGASSAILFANGAGSVVGPVAASIVMTAVGPAGLWWTIATVHGSLGLYAAYRLVKVRNIPAPFKGHWIPYPARSAGLNWVVEKSIQGGRAARRTFSPRRG
jgi:MFS family permease